MTTKATLGDLKRRVRDQADMGDSSDRDKHFITDQMLSDWINEEASELYDLLVTKYEDWFFKEMSPSISIVSGTDRYNLPEDFYKLVACDLNVSGNSWQRLDRWTMEERNVYSRYTLDTAPSVETMRYRVMGSFIQFVPIPSGTGTIRVWYVPQYQHLVKDDTELQMAVVDGWDRFIVAGAAAKALLREESDATILLGQKEAIRRKIQEAAGHRDANRPMKITNVRRFRRWLVHW